VWPAGVKWVGRQTSEQVAGLMKDAAVLVFPSVCYECAPVTIIEASACGLPAIASRIGSVPEFVRHGYNGVLFDPGDAEDLALRVRWAFDHPQELAAMRLHARREYEEKYTAERNYKMLLEIYGAARQTARRGRLVAS
jgi:glycosyltransferase involved in cell wall biosynthesis